MVDDGISLWTLRGKTINLIQQQLPHDRVGSTETCIKAINSGRAPRPGTSPMSKWHAYLHQSTFRGNEMQ